MYKLIETTITDENWKQYSSYGIMHESKTVKDISLDKEKILKLIKACNEGNLSTLHIDDIVEDFLVDLKI